LVGGGLFRVELIVDAVGWQVWVSLVVVVEVVGVALRVVAVGSRLELLVWAVGWLLWESLVVGDMLFSTVFVVGIAD
jgi:hypothetical protein